MLLPLLGNRPSRDRAGNGDNISSFSTQDTRELWSSGKTPVLFFRGSIPCLFLQTLNLWSNRIASLKHFPFSPGLEELNLTGNPFCASLGRLVERAGNLRVLRLGHTCISDPDHLLPLVSSAWSVLQEFDALESDDSWVSLPTRISDYQIGGVYGEQSPPRCGRQRPWVYACAHTLVRGIVA